MIGITPDSLKGFIKVLSEREFDEPIPSFNSLDIAKLSSALKTPFIRPFSYDDERLGILKVAAHLFCLLIESHFAPNANKRLAVISLIYVLQLNCIELKTSNIRLYAIAMAVTWLSKYGLLNQAIEEVYLFLEEETEAGSTNLMPEKEKERAKCEFVQFMQSKS